MKYDMNSAYRFAQQAFDRTGLHLREIPDGEDDDLLDGAIIATFNAPGQAPASLVLLDPTGETDEDGCDTYGSAVVVGRTIDLPKWDGLSLGAIRTEDQELVIDGVAYRVRPITDAEPIRWQEVATHTLHPPITRSTFRHLDEVQFYLNLDGRPTLVETSKGEMSTMEYLAWVHRDRVSADIKTPGSARARGVVNLGTPDRVPRRSPWEHWKVFRAALERS